MLRPRRHAVVCSLSLLACAGVARAQEARYAFKADTLVPYEVTVTADVGSETKSTVTYVAVRTKSVDAAGRATLRYATSVRFRGAPAQVFAAVKDLSTFGDEVVVDALGTLIRPENAGDNVQLAAGQGAVWQAVVQPLPPAGQSTWSTRKQIHLVRTEQSNNDNGPFGRGNPFGGGTQTRIESPADEVVTYAAQPVKDGLLTVARKYEMTALEKVGDTPQMHMVGDGQYVFDTRAGRLQSMSCKLVNTVTAKNVTYRLPIEVAVRLIPDDELAKLIADGEAAQAAAEAERAKYERNHAHDVQGETPPDGMAATDIAGTSKGGGPFMKIDADSRPVIGFRLQTADFGGRRVFRDFEPIYDKAEATADKDEIVVLAKEGYAVGALTVNAGEFVNALCVTFMKRTETGLDPKTVYASPWYGKRVGPAGKKLGGDGRLVYGTIGRKGMNVDTLGLVMAAPAADAEEKPAAEKPAAAKPAPPKPAAK